MDPSFITNFKEGIQLINEIKKIEHLKNNDEPTAFTQKLIGNVISKGLFIYYVIQVGGGWG